MKKILSIIILISFSMTLAETSFASDVRNENEIMQRQESELLSDIQRQKSLMEWQVTEAERLISETDEAEIKDPALLKNLEMNVRNCKKVETGTSDVPDTYRDILEENNLLYHSLTCNRKVYENIAFAMEKLHASMEAACSSIEEKAYDDLSELYTEAKKLLQNIPVSISGITEIQRLENCISEAERLLNDTGISVDTYRQVSEEISFSRQSTEEKIKEAEKAEQQQAAVQSGTTQAHTTREDTSQGENNTWVPVISYADSTATSADADGALTEWRQGYYIAHDWSYSGQMILSKPEKVCVNGTTYHYISSRVVSRDATWNEVKSYATGGGGIAFQTCVSGGYLIVHYEP